jgi:restriction endonuclease-like protein
VINVEACCSGSALVTSGKFIKRKLQAWAERNGICLQGSAGDRGESNYTLSVEQNIFGAALLPSVRAAFERGAGGELRGVIPTMSALHSSSALAVNLFQHWVGRKELSTLARLLEVPSQKIADAAFEDCFPVCDDPQRHGFKEPPHLDFAIRYGDGSRVGVECKLFEPYGRLDHAQLRQAYLDLPDAWADIPSCRSLAEQLAVGDAGYHRFGASQLLKHLLGLRFGAAIGTIRLIYVYYDAIGDEAAEHRDELRRFHAVVTRDGIRFEPLSVQEFILRAVKHVRAEHHTYVDYLAQRYL